MDPPSSTTRIASRRALRTRVVRRLLVMRRRWSITAVAAMLLGALLGAAAIAFYLQMHAGVVKDRALLLDAEAAHRAAQLVQAVNAGVETAQDLARRPATALALSVLQDVESSDQARKDAQQVLDDTTAGIAAGPESGLAFSTKEGLIVSRAGKFTENPLRAMKVPNSDSALLWDGGLRLNTRTPIFLGGAHAGYMLLERPLIASTAYLTELVRLGATGEIRLCGERDGTKICLPSRFAPRGSAEPADARASHPTDRAIAGERGVSWLVDERGVPSYGALMPIESLQMGLVVKQDRAEVLGPLKRQALTAGAWLALLLVAGLVALRVTVRPLERSLRDSRRQSRLAAARATESRRRLQTVADNAPVLIAFLDREHRYRYANALHAEWFGKPVGAIQGNSIRTLFGDGECVEYLAAMQASLAERRPVVLVRDLRQGDGTRVVESTVLAQFNDAGDHEGYCIVARDVTQAHTRERELMRATRRDVLTGLPNRPAFNERLAQSMSRPWNGDRFAVVGYLDVDHFKRIHDTYGHAAGDDLLKGFAERVQSVLRYSDTIARLGGDEFAILLAGVESASDVAAVAENIRRALAEPILADGEAIRITTSMGFAYRLKRDTQAQVVARADRALYEAKASGRNTFVIRIDDRADATIRRIPGPEDRQTA